MVCWLNHSEDPFLSVFGPFLGIFGVYSVQLGSFPTETPGEGSEGTKVCPTHRGTRIGAKNPSFQPHLEHIWGLFGAFWAFFHFSDILVGSFPLNTTKEGPEGTKLCPTHRDTRVGGNEPSWTEYTPKMPKNGPKTPKN